ncbi:uncharacterized protein ASCRUDRAFT_20349, partial [Ascoidea rubescens DSM 1968]
KFKLILDFVGGNELLNNYNELLLINNNGNDVLLSKYITTVGDEKANYKKDKYNTNGSIIPKESFYKMYYKFDYEKFELNLNPNKVEENRKILEMGLNLIEQNLIKVVIDSVHNWKNISEALDRVALQHTQGKVVVNVDDF